MKATVHVLMHLAVGVGIFGAARSRNPTTVAACVAVAAVGFIGCHRHHHRRLT